MQNDPTQREEKAQVFWLAFWAGFGKATVLSWALLLFLCVLVDIVGASSVDIEGVVTGQGIFAVISAILGYGAGTNAVREWRETSPSEQPIHYIIEQPIHYLGGSYQIGAPASVIEGGDHGAH
jgi:hypothetical protein